jgi:hypothetical protein
MPATSGATAARPDVRQGKGIQTVHSKKIARGRSKAWLFPQMVESRHELQAHCRGPRDCLIRSVPTLAPDAWFPALHRRVRMRAVGMYSSNAKGRLQEWGGQARFSSLGVRLAGIVWCVKRDSEDALYDSPEEK